MAAFKFPCMVLRNVLGSISGMADDTNVFFEPDRGIRFKLVCFVGYVDGAIFFRKETLFDFKCPKRASACFEIMQLGRALTRLDTDNFIDLHFDPDELVISICTEKFRHLTPERLLMEPTEERHAEVALMEERTEFMKIDESKFEYDLIIGIPSIHFVHMLKDAEVHHFVTIYVKEREVWFKVKNKAFPLHKELGKLVSVGPTFDKPVAAEFALYRITTFLLASELTNMVWLCWSTDAPPLLIFPFGTLGSFHVYSRLFPEKKLKRSPAHQLENKQVS